jgi:hypothetical protein
VQLPAGLFVCDRVGLWSYQILSGSGRVGVGCSVWEGGVEAVDRLGLGLGGRSLWRVAADP